MNISIVEEREQVTLLTLLTLVAIFFLVLFMVDLGNKIPINGSCFTGKTFPIGYGQELLNLTQLWGTIL